MVWVTNQVNDHVNEEIWKKCGQEGLRYRVGGRWRQHHKTKLDGEIF